MCSFRDDEERSAAAEAVPADDIEAVMAENACLRQRIEELREIVDGQPPPSSGGGGGATGALPGSSRGHGARGGRKGGGGGGGGSNAAPAAAIALGLGATASDAILRGQVAQLRRQVKLQWCAVDASSAVTQEVTVKLVRGLGREGRVTGAVLQDVCWSALVP